MQFAIADKNSDANALAALFSSSISPQYISHAELQGRRALRRGTWASDIESVLREEIVERLGPPRDTFPHAEDWRGVVEARDDEGRLIGLALVALSRDAAVPFGTIEDIVVDQSRRGAGLGRQMMQWIIDEMRKAGAKRAFLESGLGNEAAHDLFEKLGFETLSIVMMRDL